MKVFALTLGLLLLLGTGNTAQAPAEPVLSAEQRANLAILELQVENAVLRLRLAVQSLATDDYELTKTADGAWAYVKKKQEE